MDILTDDNNELLIRNGDFVLGDSDNQQTYFLMESTFNYFKNSPFLALNFRNNLNGVYRKATVQREIRQILLLDGFTRIDIDIPRNDLNNVNVNARRI